MEQRTEQALRRALQRHDVSLFSYAKKLFEPSPDNTAAIQKIASSASRLTFVPEGLSCRMSMHVSGESVKFAKGTIWVPVGAAQRFDVCQNQIQADEIDGAGELSSTFYCGNKSLPCPRGLQFMPTAYTLKECSSQSAVWQLTDGDKSTKVTREQALKQRLSKLPKVLGSGGTEVLARVTEVAGRWLEVQQAGDLSAPVASITSGWAHAFLERGPWRGNTKLATLSKTYDVALTVEQYYVPDGGDGDSGFWILAEVTGSIKRAELVGTWLTVAFLPSMGLPKLPHRVTGAPPKPVVEVVGAEAITAMVAASAEPSAAPETTEPAAAASSSSAASAATGESSSSYWSVEAGAKRSRKTKAPMNSGATML